MSDYERCGAVYDGPSYPEDHGASCNMPKGHDSGPPHGSARHCGRSIAYPGKPISWYAAEQKAARAKEKAA